MGGYMASIGQELQRERQRKNISLEEAERVLHIRAVYLEALEKDDYKVIPGDVYLKGFLRNYGNFLGLSGERLVDSYKTLIGEPLGVPRRRLVSPSIQSNKEEVNKEQEVLEKPSKRLTYEGRRQRRERTIIRERIMATIISVIMLAFLYWLFLV